MRAAATADRVSRDAVRPDPAASYDQARDAVPFDRRGRALLSAQLGRPARGRSAPVHRCVFGLPTVVRVDPRLEDGTPFPTVFWLSCPVLRAQVGTLESEGAMVAVNERLDRDEDFRSAHAAAQDRFRAFRRELGGPLPGRPYAGGDDKYVKCLHVHVAHHLAAGDSPVGARAFEQLSPVACPGPCVTGEDLDAWEPRLPAEGPT